MISSFFYKALSGNCLASFGVCIHCTFGIFTFAHFPHLGFAHFSESRNCIHSMSADLHPVISGIDGGDSDDGDFVEGDDGYYSMLAKSMAILGGMPQQELSIILLQFNLGD